MLETIVRYLHRSNVPFKLASYPSQEESPMPAHPLPVHGVLTDARFLNVGGQLVLACCRAGDEIDLAAIGNALGGAAVDALPDELPEAVLRTGTIGHTFPPLGKMLGVPVVVDETVETCATIVFHAASASDYLEMPYDEFARMEQPRVASFARAGELGMGA